MDKYVCIHGHFYQPPRENPWLEDVELQDSAHPHHDWNWRVTEECYRRNAVSRILGSDKKIVDIVNNYASMSFNFGPTLFYWLQLHVPEVYEKIIEADRKSLERFSGHGCAIAQAYNHMIMPLANEHDRITQVIWGIRDFQYRFGRAPEGMWLPETAVDTPSLETLAENGIKFTILSPRQAKRTRRIGEGSWTDVNEHNLDTTSPYLCNLPSGRRIAIFFYHGATAHEVAYGGLLHSGENFAARLMKSFSPAAGPQLVHIATDGESFGHHHRHGDMALAYCLHNIQTHELARVTVYGEYLEKFPPTAEVEIHQNSSWSCQHGIERWRSNCGCCHDQSQCGRQQWKEPLRRAMDHIRDNMADIYQKRISAYTADPWSLRNDYIAVINDRSSENVNNFILAQTGQSLDYGDRLAFMKLLEMQRNAMLMYTSCGWFFDNISRIEPIQIMRYAARAIQLCNEVSNRDLTDQFKDILKEAPGATDRMANGKDVYEARAESASIDLTRVGAHFALSSLFEERQDRGTTIYSYSAKIENFQKAQAGAQVLTTQKATVRSEIIFEEYSLESVALYLGDLNLFAAVRPRKDNSDFESVRRSIVRAFRAGDANEVVRLMNISFGGKTYSLPHLFKDQQRKILNRLLATIWDEIESSFRHIYEHHYATMLLIRNMNMPIPKALAGPAEFILNQDIRRQIRADKINLGRLRSLSEEAQRLSLELDTSVLSFEATRRINKLMAALDSRAEDLELLQSIEDTLDILKSITPDMDLQTAQNIFFTIGRRRHQQARAEADAGSQAAGKWIEHFENLAHYLGLSVS